MALQNAICTAYENPDKEIYLIYGKAHTFIEMAKCFPDLEINFIDYSMSTLSEKDAQYLNQTKMKEAKPPTCEWLHNKLAQHPPMLRSCSVLQLSTPQPEPQSQTSSFNYSNVAGTATLIGVGSLLFFKAAKAAYKYFYPDQPQTVKPTENDHKISESAKPKKSHNSHIKHRKKT